MPQVLFAQFDAGQVVTINLGEEHTKTNTGQDGLDPFDPVTINPGVPVTLTAGYGLIATPVNLTDNSVSPLYNIGFIFNFFGDTCSLFSIGDNGWISFEHNSAWAARRNIRIPTSPIIDPGSPQNCILGSMEDYDPGKEGGPYIFFKTIGVAPNRKLVVMWCQCPMIGCPDSLVTFQIVLNEDGDTIENHILKKPVCQNWDNQTTLGIQKYISPNELYQGIPNRNAQSWSVNPNNPEAWQYFPTSPTTYDVKPVPFGLEPITPGDKIQYRWYEGSGTDPFSWDQTVVVTPSETTTYRVTATICNGETFSGTVTVTVVPKIPDAFTPNEDGLNDTFEIIGLPAASITKYNIKIYDRWGQMVFTETDIMKPWNGKMNNTAELCPDGAYVWVIYYENANRTKVTNKGSVILLR